MTPSSFLTLSQKILLAYTKQCEVLLKEYDIPQVSFDILMFLHNNPEFSTAQEISEMRHIRKNLVSVHVERLVNAGFLRRSPVTGDRRKIALACTEKATPILSAGHLLQERFFIALSDGIDSDMWKTLEELNTRLADNAELLLRDEMPQNKIEKENDQ